MKKPRIAIAGLGCETSTFSPARTLATDFRQWRGGDIVQLYPFLRTGQVLGDAADWQCALVGHALPGGIVVHEAYEALSQEILDRLQAIVKDGGPIDGLWYDIHGAMVVEGLTDFEATLLQRIRAVVGAHVIISTSMDLHGNVSRELAHLTDLITTYRTAPHVDVAETKRRACGNLLKVLTEHSLDRPLKAWIPIPICLPGEKTSTRLEPAKSLYEAVPEVEKLDGVLDAGIWVGYAWADEERSHAAIVVTGWNRDVVCGEAKALALGFWQARRDFKFVAPTGSLKECLDHALASSARPYFISDSGDNPTAGGCGDVTWTLHRILDRAEFEPVDGPKLVYASVPAGKDTIDALVAAGRRAKVTVTVGAMVDHTHAGPVEITGVIHSIKQGDPWAIQEVVIRTGSVYVILTERRKPYHKKRDFTDLELDIPRDIEIVVVKIGYLEPELFEMAADWMLALTPGGVDQDIEHLPYHNIQRPMWPFDKEYSGEPDLTARLIPASNVPDVR